MYRVTEEGGYPAYLYRATSLRFRLLPPCRGRAHVRTALSIFVASGPVLAKTAKLGVPPEPIPEVI
jgi:hypothetical protein